MLDLYSSKFELMLAIVIVILLGLILYSHRKAYALQNNDAAVLGVQDLIQKVKAELIKSEQHRIEAKQPPLFELKDFELEINYVVKVSDKNTGAVALNVVTIGGDTEVSSERVQKIKLRLTAVAPEFRQEKASATPLNIEGDDLISEPPPMDKKR